jgi:thiopurine S-methyltransferase
VTRPAGTDPGLVWEERYRSGNDGWELGSAAPPLREFLHGHPLAPQPPARVLVPGCGRGHEARLLADLGFETIGLDISGLALDQARRQHGESGRLRWLQADLFDAAALERAGLTPSSLGGVLEHTCYCAIEPECREAYLATVRRLLAPGGWLLGLFWCHGRPGGPPYGGDPAELTARIGATGLVAELWEPAQNSAIGRQGTRREDEWLGLWRAPAVAE